MKEELVYTLHGSVEILRIDCPVILCASLLTNMENM